MLFNVSGIGNVLVIVGGGDHKPIKLTSESSRLFANDENTKISKNDLDCIQKTLSRFKKEFSKRKDVHIEFNDVPIRKTTEHALQKGLIQPGYYGRLAPGAGNLAWSLYKMLLRHKTMKRGGLLRRDSRKIVRDYDKGSDIDQLVKKYDHPPTSIMRVILRESYGLRNPIDVKHMLQKPSKSLVKKLSQSEYDDLVDQIEWAHENDVVASARQDIIAERADEYEQHIGKFLKKHKIRMASQDDLVSKQKAEHGRAIATPDFLLNDPVYINDVPISWIDAKHYYGGDLDMIRESLSKQVLRYNKLWGYGALVFSAGFSEDLKVPGAMLLQMDKPSHASLKK